ncbi:MAG: hypothetical protein ACK5B9_14975 [Flavobacteriia bacterium]|jgi:hypothetical protein
MFSKFFLLLTCICSISLYGQKFATSPFTSYGLGELGTYDNATFIGYGNANVAVIDSLNLNYFNPSSYSFLATGQPLFSTGISYKNSLYTENGNEFSNNLVGINHFIFAVPFAKRFGLAFGLKPYSRVGYSFYENDIFGTDTVKYAYSGTGSVNDVFTGFSIKILNAKKHQLGIGTNFSYLFGSTEKQRTSNLTSQTLGGMEIDKFQVQSLYYNIGLNYQFHLTKSQKLTLAATYNSKQNIATTRTEDLYFLTNVENINTIKDTISSFEQASNITMPSMLDIGFAYSFRPKVDSSYNKTKIYQVNVYGSYQMQKWSEYSENFTNDTAVKLLNSTKISFGLEYAPHYVYLERSKAIGYFSRMRYRAGFQMMTLPLERNDIQLKSTCFTAGVSLPITSQRSVSSLNFGFSYGNNGNGQANSLNERFIGVNFGITLAPGAFDKWFRKYKID